MGKESLKRKKNKPGSNRLTQEFLDEAWVETIDKLRERWKVHPWNYEYFRLEKKKI